MRRIIIFLLLLSNLVFAEECFKHFGQDWINNYVGNIDNKYQIGISFLRDTKTRKINGKYYYKSQLKDINITATIDDRNITINEYDENNQITAQFIGEFAKKDPRKHYGNSELQCEVITGTWKNNKGIEYPFYLKLKNAYAGTLEHRYEEAGIKDDEAFEKAVASFYKGVQEDDKKEVAKHIDYPLYNYDYKKKDYISVKNEKEFIKNYEKIITKKVKEEILNDSPKNLFIRGYSPRVYSNDFFSGGAMIGQGTWFGENYKIRSIFESNWSRKKYIHNPTVPLKVNTIFCSPEKDYFAIHGDSFRIGTIRKKELLDEILSKPINKTSKDYIDSYIVYGGDNRIYECKLKGRTIKFQITPSPLNDERDYIQRLKVWDNDILFVDIKNYNNDREREKQINKLTYQYSDGGGYPDRAYIYIYNVPPNWRGIYEENAYQYNFKSYIPEGWNDISSYELYKDKPRKEQSFSVITDKIIEDMYKIAEKTRADKKVKN